MTPVAHGISVGARRDHFIPDPPTNALLKMEICETR
jgi:hypothetical protein